MRQILIALCAIMTVATAGVLLSNKNENTRKPLLGAKKCSQGPGYWCQDIKTSAHCKATTWCIGKKWTEMQVDNDTDSVCGICKDMVQQARDQLESNVTQQDLKSVFEGSCALMQIKPIVKECDVLVDQFVPELVETLASQMNPSVVCSVAGLCNSAHIDKLIEQHEKTLKEDQTTGESVSLSDDELKPNDCSRCYTIAAHMKNKFTAASADDVLDNMLAMCGKMGSFSDACSSIAIEYFSSIYPHLQENFEAKNICHLSGQCSSKFHVHEEPEKNPQVDIRPLSTVGMVDVGDDLPCELCEKLVVHLKDLLVANTTEKEFQQVLNGLCKQTRSFAPECKNIVDQYYPEIYNYLVHGMNSNKVCEMVTICPSAGKEVSNGPITPLLPLKTHELGARIMRTRKNFGENGAGTRQIEEKTEAEEMQLPLDRMMGLSVLVGAPKMDVDGQKTCAFCELLMDYLQQVITNPAAENEVKQALDNVCERMPSAVEETCLEFVKSYGDALVGLISHEIDASVVCPMMHVCPSEEFMNAWAQIPEELMLKSEVEDKPSCPLCLLAVGQLYNVIKDDKTEANIEKELDKVCHRLPKNFAGQCESLVKGYSKELVGMLIADMTPEEVCDYIKLCQPNADSMAKHPFAVDKEREILTNEIPDYYPVATQKPKKESTECVVCEFMMQYLEKAMKNKSTREEIEDVVHGVCNHMPKTISQECNGFVNQYADLVIDMLSDEVSPKEVCTFLELCRDNMEQFQDSVKECAMCEGIVYEIDNLLGNSKVDEEIEQVASQVCRYLPAAKQDKCTMMMKVYEQSIINILREDGKVKKICTKIHLCDSGDFYAMKSKKSYGKKVYP